MLIPEKLQNMKPYDPSEDIYRIKLDANESPFPPNAEISQEIASALSQVSLNRYPDPKSGIVCQKAAEIFGVSMDNVAAGNGSDELISLVLGAFLQKGGRLMLLAPEFSMYAIYANLCELTVKTVCKDEDMKITVDEIIKEAKQWKPDAVLFSNPCNPTGQGIAKKDMLRLLSSLDCLLVIDEAYMDFYGQSVLPEICGYKNVIVLRTASKAFGSAAMRLGFAIGTPSLIAEIHKARSPFNVNSFTQAAGAVMLSKTEYIRESTGNITALKNELENDLEKLCAIYPDKIGIQKTVTNFAILKTKNANMVYNALLKKSICVRCFDGFLRITAGTKEENRELLSALAEIMKSGRI